MIRIEGFITLTTLTADKSGLADLRTGYYALIRPASLFVCQPARNRRLVSRFLGREDLMGVSVSEIT